MEVITQKHLFKKTFNGKARGCIDFFVKLDNNADITGSITGDYDYIDSFDDELIVLSLKLIFKEVEKWREESQQNS